MSIVKVRRKQGNYTAISNVLLHDRRLSWEATGMLAFLLSKPDDWQCRPQYLIKQRKAGRDKVRRILKELETCGYMRRYKIRDVRGRFTWMSIVFEIPDSEPIQAIDGFSGDGASMPGFSVNGSTVNGKSGHILSTDLISTNRTTETGREPPPPASLPVSASELAAAAAVNLEDNEEVKKYFLLKDAGVGAKMMAKILQADHCTSDFIRGHLDAKTKEQSLGLVITKMLDGDALPEEADYIPDEFRDIVKR